MSNSCHWDADKEALSLRQYILYVDVVHVSSAKLSWTQLGGNKSFDTLKWILLTVMLLLWWRAPWWSVTRARGHWPFSRLSLPRCWLTVHQHQSPSASWYVSVHKVSSNDWAVRATPQWLDGDVPRAQKRRAVSLEKARNWYCYSYSTIVTRHSHM